MLYFSSSPGIIVRVQERVSKLESFVFNYQFFLSAGLLIFSSSFLDFHPPVLNNPPMHNSPKIDFTRPVFKIGNGDTFHKIIVSNPVLFELTPDVTTVITLIAIRRATGHYAITNLFKTFQKAKCVSRSIQVKNGVTPPNIEKQMVKMQADFTNGIRAQTNYKVQWDTLDLSKVAEISEQLQAIKKWGKLKVC